VAAGRGLKGDAEEEARRGLQVAACQENARPAQPRASNTLCTASHTVNSLFLWSIKYVELVVEAFLVFLVPLHPRTAASHIHVQSRASKQSLAHSSAASRSQAQHRAFIAHSSAASCVRAQSREPNLQAQLVACTQAQLGALDATEIDGIMAGARTGGLGWPPCRPPPDSLAQDWARGRNQGETGGRERKSLPCSRLGEEGPRPLTFRCGPAPALRPLGPWGHYGRQCASFSPADPTTETESDPSGSARPGPARPGPAQTNRQLGPGGAFRPKRR
jgi:hypothetical protein